MTNDNAPSCDPFLNDNPSPEEQAALLRFTERVDAAINQAGGIRQLLSPQAPPSKSRRPRRGGLTLHDPDAVSPWSMPFRGEVS